MQIALSVILWLIFGLILIASIRNIYLTYKKRKEKKEENQDEE